MKKRIRNLVLLWLAAPVLALAVLRLQISCPIKQLTGLDCPGCGATRMLRALLQGQTAEALAYNGFLVFALPVGLALAVYASFLYARTGRVLQTKGEKLCLLFLTCSAILFGLLRNIF